MTVTDHSARRGGFQAWLALAMLLLVGCAPALARPVRVIAGGDLQLDGAARVNPLAGDVLAGDLLAGDVLAGGVLRFVNLEGPLTARGVPSGLDAEGRPTGGPIRFQASPSRAAWLAGRVEVASLANNHALDEGEAGRADTAHALASAGVATAWPGHDAALSVGGRRVTVLARDYPSSADLDGADELVAAVARAHARGLAIVSLHWGDAGSLLPSEAQRRLAARLVGAGAVAVLGHGPHAPQGIERRAGAVIAYSLGNLAFGCRCTEVADSYLLAFTIDERGRATEVRALLLTAGLAGAPPRRSNDPGLLDLIETLSRDLGSKTTRNIDSISIP